MTSQLVPVNLSERLGVMDSLRGFALIGILLMNIEWFNRPVAGLGTFDISLNGADYGVSWFVKIFIEGKFYKLFALLFGMGFAVMLIRAQQTGRSFTGMFVRRMVALFIIGVLHYILLWDGDILHDYAFAGLLLFGWVKLLNTNRLKRFSKPVNYLKISVCFLSFPIVAMILAGNYIGMTKDHDVRQQAWDEQVAIVTLADELLQQKKLEEEKLQLEEDSDEEQTEELEQEEKDVDLMTSENRVKYLAEEKAQQQFDLFLDEEDEKIAVTDSSFWTSVADRAEYFPTALVSTIGFSFFMLVPIFMLGYWFIASGAISTPDKYPHLFSILGWSGLVIGLGITTASLHIMQSPITSDTIYINNAAQTSFQFAQYLVAAGYLGVFVSIYQFPRWRARLDRLAPLGRMALTNYIMHTVILVLIFYGYGAGMFGEISRAPQLLIVAGITVLQLVLSTWWLKRFRFGPLEWLWRCITYQKLQPMKI